MEASVPKTNKRNEIIFFFFLDAWGDEFREINNTKVLLNYRALRLVNTEHNSSIIQIYRLNVPNTFK